MAKRFFITFTFILICFIMLTFSIAAAKSNSHANEVLWQPVAEATMRYNGTRRIIPSNYQTLFLNQDYLETVLAQAPLEGEGNTLSLTLPLPDGTFGRFAIVESPIMAPELAAKYPDITTYVGRGLDDPTAYTRLDWTPHGFHAIILSSSDTIYIDPYSFPDTNYYISYYKQDNQRETEFVKHPPETSYTDMEALLTVYHSLEETPLVGESLRTYRLAVAATGEYTQFHGGTVADGLAAIVTAVNRVTAIYEREVAVRLVLIANNNLIVYTNGATDPYSNDSGGAMLGQNQSNLDAVIGSANYDIGHVFSTGGGGVATLGVPCRIGLKARGVTGLTFPIGDTFYVDYVAHEMGHQFGANHTFNGNSGSCSGGNRNGSTAYEPGSATTIMGYAGICSPQNTQNYSDDYFHGISFDEIRAYTTIGFGGTCGTTSSTGNSDPVADAGDSYTIPINTPFVLTGSATDPDSDPLTYNWEEFDLGPAGHPNSPVGNAPIFRSFLATTSPSRTFPQLSDLLNNSQTMGELLPSYARTMTFRLTVRDNHVYPSAGGVDFDTTTVTASAQAGPFLVTYPNTAVTWTGSSAQTVTWNVANTTQSPVNCAAVDIRLSTDGGQTYPISILSNTVNDGSQLITVPNQATTTARLKVACSDNIFFDISDTNFTIEAGDPSAFLTIEKEVMPTGAIAPGDTLTYTIQVTNTGTLAANTTITDTFAAGLLNPVCNGTEGDLAVTTMIAAQQTAVYTCTAQVDDNLNLHIEKTADQTAVAPGTAVTYTITVSNPSSLYTLNNVTVTDTQVNGCLPSLGTPVVIAPQQTQTYVCANNVITSTTQNTAVAAGEYSIENTAMASAPEDPAAEISSTVGSIIFVTAQAQVTVVAGQQLFLPIILK